MRLYENTRPSQGVSYRPWAERVKELLDEHDLDMPPSHELHSYYHQNFSYEEVLFKQQFKTRRNVWMEVHVTHGHLSLRSTKPSCPRSRIPGLMMLALEFVRILLNLTPATLKIRSKLPTSIHNSILMIAKPSALIFADILTEHENRKL